MVNGIPQMQPEEFKRRRDAGEDLFLLDVREPYEYAIAQMGGQLIPLNDLPKRAQELDPDTGNRRALQSGRTQPDGG